MAANWSDMSLAETSATTAGTFRQRYELHLAIIFQTIEDMRAFGVSEGYTGAQIRTVIESLFRTFASEWFLWLITESSDLTTAIQNDATLGWLDTDVSGQTLRQRLITRLTL